MHILRGGGLIDILPKNIPIMKKATRLTRSTLTVVFILLLTLASCKPKRPAGILSPAQMESLLVDYHLAQGMAEAAGEGKNMEELRYIYIRAALKKHHIDEAVFDSSIVYYSANSEQLAVICAHVCDRIEAMGGVAGTGDGDDTQGGKYAHLTTQGDTANVWTGMRHATLMPDILHNLLVLTWQADTATRAGDSFVWYCNSQKVAQGNLPDVYVQLIVRYENDTVTSMTSHIYGDRDVEVFYTPYSTLDSLRPTSVTAMVFMSTREQAGADGQSKNNAEALLLRDISLVRMHKKPVEQPVQPESAKAPADSTEAKEAVPTSQPASHEEQPAETSRKRLTPIQLRDAHPHAATIQVQKEKSEHPFAPSRNPRPRRGTRH